MYKTIDLFAGAGGLSLGFKQTGKCKILAAAEIQDSARKTYKKNIPESFDDFVFIDNVVGYDFKKLNEKLGGIDIVIGGPPCQGFSNANRQKNHLISMNNALVMYPSLSPFTIWIENSTPTANPKKAPMIINNASFGEGSISLKKEINAESINASSNSAMSEIKHSTKSKPAPIMAPSPVHKITEKKLKQPHLKVVLPLFGYKI